MNGPVAMRAHLVEARDVAKSFGKTPALRGASVAVSPGEILAVMGPSGSGEPAHHGGGVGYRAERLEQGLQLRGDFPAGTGEQYLGAFSQSC
jgi:ABC-type uncharacterized transport system YnjBCD ATPase subunit